MRRCLFISQELFLETGRQTKGSIVRNRLGEKKIPTPVIETNIKRFSAVVEEKCYYGTITLEWLRRIGNVADPSRLQARRKMSIWGSDTFAGVGAEEKGERREENVHMMLIRVVPGVMSFLIALCLYYEYPMCLRGLSFRYIGVYTSWGQKSGRMHSAERSRVSL